MRRHHISWYLESTIKHPYQSTSCALSLNDYGLLHPSTIISIYWLHSFPRTILYIHASQAFSDELAAAISNKDLEIVKLLVEKLSPEDQKNYMNLIPSSGETALQQAVFLGLSREFIKYLLDHGADPNRTDESNETLLHEAAKLGRGDLMECLLESMNPAWVDMKNNKNVTAWDFATGRKGENRWKAIAAFVLHDWTNGSMNELFKWYKRGFNTYTLQVNSVSLLLSKYI